MCASWRQSIEHNAKDAQDIRSFRKLDDFLYKELLKESVNTQHTDLWVIASNLAKVFITCSLFVVHEHFCDNG